MSGINAFFHVGSALAAGFLVYWLLRVKRQRDFLRQLLAASTKGEGRVYVASPPGFLGIFAEALGISFEAQPTKSKLAKISAQPFLDLFLNQGILLIRCKDPEIEVYVSRTISAEKIVTAEMLRAALGNDVRISIVAPT